MIIRESPSPSKSSSKAAWPPRSPNEAAISSPTRQKRLAQHRDESPTPVKRRRTHDAQPEINIGSDDDEETLALKLQQIQTQLKLKKLQKAKQQTKAGKENDVPVQVPHSPKAQRAPVEPVSPKRVQLGIDRGLRAANVSLKRARPATKPHDERVREPAAKRKTFSERLLDERSQDLRREEKYDRMEARKGHGFGISRDHPSMSTAAPSRQLFKDPSEPTEKSTEPDSHATRDKTATAPRSENRHATPLAPRDQPSEETEDYDPHTQTHLRTRHLSPSTLTEAFEGKTIFTIPQLLKQVTAPHYDPPDLETDFVVVGTIASKSTPYSHAPKTLPKSTILDKNIDASASTNTGEKGKDEEEEEPTFQDQKTKFMILKLTDLKWELDLFLFSTAFSAFWKLPVGTVIAILNPGIMPPKPAMQHSGAFSLKLASSEDTVSEVGVSRDLGWCKSVKKDGKVCNQWVDRRRSEFCEWHVNLGVERARAGRMEVNGMVGVGLFAGQTSSSSSSSRGRRDGGRGGGRGGHWSDVGNHKEFKKDLTGAKFNRATGEVAYVIPKEYGSGGNAARLLDAEDYVHGGLSKAERSQKRLAAFEKERELAKALGSSGSGVAAEYMRKKRSGVSEPDEVGRPIEQELDERPRNAAELGLLGNDASNVRLSPSKRRRDLMGTSSKANPVGWGGANRRGIVGESARQSEEPQPQQEARIIRNTKEASPQKEADDASPRKKARFLLEKKGIRLPGRDSLAAKRSSRVGADDDDDLDII